MEEIELQAHGKINLALDVLGKRSNGYHDVRMIMQSVGLSDTVLLRREKQEGIRLRCTDASLPTDRRNLMVKAAELLFREFSLEGGLYMELHKRLPVSAGMAGGSTDAAAVLTGLNLLFSLSLKEKELEKRAVQLGADVPFCLHRGTYLAEGIGEKLTKLPSLPPCCMILVKPRFSLSTKVIYEELDRKDGSTLSHPDVESLLHALNTGDLKEICSYGGNVLEAVSIPMQPEIQRIKDFFLEKGALLSLMSGSGPTVFSIFPKEEQHKAEGLIEELKSSTLSPLLENVQLSFPVQEEDSCS